MLHRALQQFLADVYWGDLDVLLLDLPPARHWSFHLDCAGISIVDCAPSLADTNPDDASIGQAGVLAVA